MMPTPSDSVIAKFWAKVDRSGGTDACWMWQAGKDKDGYGKFQFIPSGAVRQVHVRAHRFALAVTAGGDGEVAKHSCDTPGCCNPRHLEWGTVISNRMDCVARGRHARGATHAWVVHPELKRRGEDAPNSRLTDAQIEDIRRRYVPRKGVGDLAREFGVGRSYINAIGTGRGRGMAG